VQRVKGSAGKISETVKAAQPVTFLPQATVVTALTGRIKKTVVRTISETDIVQHEQAWIR
jgi:hypothetical protein